MVSTPHRRKAQLGVQQVPAKHTWLGEHRLVTLQPPLPLQEDNWQGPGVHEYPVPEHAPPEHRSL